MLVTEFLVRTYCPHLPLTYGTRPRTFLQRKHSHPYTRLYSVLTQTTLWILTTMNISNPVPRNIKNNWNVDGNVTLGKLNSRIVVSFTVMLFNTTYFSTNCVHCVAYFVSKKLREWTIISINTHSGSGPHTNNFTRKFNFSGWNFLHSTYNCNTANFQYSQCYTTVNKQNTKNYNTKVNSIRTCI